MTENDDVLITLNVLSVSKFVCQIEILALFYMNIQDLQFNCLFT